MANLTDPSLTFEGVDVPFNYTNDEWALSNLPWVRAASLMMKYDDRDLTAKMGEIARGGAAPDLLDHISQTKSHLEAIVELLNTVLARSFVALERLGYSPDSPPPEHVQSLN